MDDHVGVLEQRVEPAALGRRRGEEGVEGVVVDDHQEQEEHLDDRDHSDDVRHQLAMALAIDVDGGRTEDRQQKHPEHDRAVETAPVRRDLVEQRLNGVGVTLDVVDGVIAGDESVDDDARGHRHQRRDEVERADAGVDQSIVSRGARRRSRRPPHRYTRRT